MLRPERARELLSYDPGTGVLRWRVSRGRTARSGDEAGYIHSEGYRHIKINGQQYKAHRVAFLIVTGRWPREQMDHINGIRDDNRWANLRETNHQGNARNRQRPCTNTSGHLGVSWYKPYDKWVSHIRLNGRQKCLGYFDDLAKAIAARKAAEREYGYHENHGRAV